MTDLISRQAAIDAIHEDADWLAAQGSDWQVERMERDKSILRSLPSTQPERKTGRWIESMKCSECGGEPWYSSSEKPYAFCPYCGARMKEGEKDEVD